ncbi:hypothetical protein Baya_5771 [Bagarius yarrelli]|uniref:Uncharacterized protein n=1 Tax=Bagarius yarrelli TaxID=175774 RepID=A0A556TYF4_BAGYA|nr:hypothetical protein Baya_5771 [Bagarius yarrelli]
MLGFFAEKFSERSPGAYLHTLSFNHPQSSSLSYRGADRDHLCPDDIRSTVGGRQLYCENDDKDKKKRRVKADEIRASVPRGFDRSAEQQVEEK